ncbi:MAG TPA: hypothetical protein VD947_03430 [Patescibacteria group bacterium]|nr:hypothetical protein [Patescibacteria group bacterium]
MNPQDTTDGLPQNQNNPTNSSDGAQTSSQTVDQTDDLRQGQDVKAQTDSNTQTAVEIDLPVEAEDNDLIEKEWVDRAKQIVEHTKEDPYEQQRALSQMKADYMKKRYNKDIKISDG